MKFIKFKSKRSLIIISTIVLIPLLVIGGIWIWRTMQDDIDRGPKPFGTTTMRFQSSSTFYECSKAIEGNWIKDFGQGIPIWSFVPNSQSEFKKYCREGWSQISPDSKITPNIVIPNIEPIEEYRAVLDILKRDDVKATIAKYSPAKASVKALGHVYINDKDYLRRILPAYADVKIDCIIVVHSPEGTRFFVENGEVHNSHADHHYIEVPAKEFLASLNNASDDDVTNFWLGLH